MSIQQQEFQIPKIDNSEIAPDGLGLVEQIESEALLESVEFDPILIDMANEIMGARDEVSRSPKQDQRSFLNSIVNFLRSN